MPALPDMSNAAVLKRQAMTKAAKAAAAKTPPPAPAAPKPRIAKGR
jgi:hypothetical protein